MKKIIAVFVFMLIFVSVFVFSSKQSSADDNRSSLSRELIQTIVNKVLELNSSGSTNAQIVEEIVTMTSNNNNDDDDDEEDDDNDSDKINRGKSAIKKINYGQFKKTIRMGNSGDDVMSLQEALNALSEKLGLNFNLQVDGKYGRNTVRVVKLIQERQRLMADGVVGPMTLAMFMNLLGEGTTVINTAPIITLTGEASVSLNVGGTYTDAGATAMDAEDGNISANIVKTISLNNVAVESVSTTAAGVYTINYNVSDSKGLAAVQVSRTVTVIEVTE